MGFGSNIALAFGGFFSSVVMWTAMLKTKERAVYIRFGIPPPTEYEFNENDDRLCEENYREME